MKKKIWDYPRGYRHYKPGAFADAMQACSREEDMADRINCEYNVREAYRRFEQGRLYDSIDKMHNMLSRFDPDEVEQFKKDFPDTVKLVNEFGTVEDLKKF